MALLPNNVFERNQVAGGRQATEQAQLGANAARANTPAQAAVTARGNRPPPTPQFLVGGISGETSQMPANMGNSGAGAGLAEIARQVGGALTANGPAPVNTVGDPGLNPMRRGAPAGPGINFDREYTLGTGGFEAVPANPAAPAGPPPSSIQAPPPDAIRAPRSAGGVGYQPPNLMDTVAQGVERMSQPALQTTPQAPLEPDVVGSPGYTGDYVPGQDTGAPGGTFNVMSSGAFSGNYGINAGQGGQGGVMPTGQQTQAPSVAASPSLQQPGGQLVDAFMQARDDYLNMNSTNSSLGERGRALNALKALAPQATTEQKSQASMYGDDQALRRGIGVADIGRDASLGSTALTQMGGMDRAVLQAQTQRRGQDLGYDVNSYNAQSNRMNAEAQMAGAQPDPLQVLVQQMVTQEAAKGNLGLGEVATYANGEVPAAPTLIMDELGNTVGLNTPNGPMPVSPQQLAWLEQMGAISGEQAGGMTSYYQNVRR